ncbi:NAD-dependent epimerase/dehydratase family protein [Glycomyces buryatensis]|uniref:NAD-dependent epimerase/dehydratase family protein n=1 Tax=Glycomyces buryatensis TaxID=2570927 RepID=A0A4S8QAL5_9ACTN|nr:NAD-dependent epimerase/dehydratase family protein [Glycomyces buryatensis]THV41507.1 NAD-dependent epimerase/dehydratase family protein [Glycomyces buryatensis]
MKIVVIGGSGHIGTYLVPRLVRAGHEVVNISRGKRNAYADAPEWEQVRQVTADREQEDADGVFGDTVAALRPDAVVDLVCFTPESAAALLERLRGRTGHLLHCGSIWRYGLSRRAPIVEGEGTAPFGEYGIQKDRIARMLKEETTGGGLVMTSLHPGHIVGPGWHPIGPLGNLDPEVWRTLSSGRTLRIPGIGAEHMHHVHADDVAQGFALAIEHRDAAGGEDFHLVAPTAMNVRGLATAAASWFGQEASLESVSWDEFRSGTTAEHADTSWEHLSRSQVCSIEKARTLLGYAPAYEPDAAILESVRWLIEHGRIDVERPLAV